MTNTHAKQIRVLEIGIAEIEQERVACALKLHDAPDSIEALQEMQAIEGSLDELQRSLARVKLGAAAAAARNSAEAKEARLAARRAALDHVGEDVQASIEIAARIEKAVCALAVPLAEFEQLVRNRTKFVSVLCRDAHGSGASFHDNTALATGDINIAFVDLLVACGLGSSGPRGAPWLALDAPVKPPKAKPRLSLVEAVTRANERMLRGVHDAVAQIERKEDEAAA